MKFIILFISFFFAFGVSAQDRMADHRATAHMEPFHISISASKVRDIQALQGQNLVLIDLRSPDEVAQGKIKGALEIDLKSPDFKERIAALDKTKQYMLYDYAGGLSNKAMQMMIEMGFKQVYNIKDGYRQFKELNDVK